MAAPELVDDSGLAPLLVEAPPDVAPERGGHAAFRSVEELLDAPPVRLRSDDEAEPDEPEPDAE
jgi:hypothetical protein